jgi:hypothetical protein
MFVERRGVVEPRSLGAHGKHPGRGDRMGVDGRGAFDHVPGVARKSAIIADRVGLHGDQ